MEESERYPVIDDLADDPPQDDPMLRLKYYQSTGQADEAKKYETYLRSTGQFRAPTGGGHDIHSEYASGNLAKRMARENTNDAEAAASEAPSYAEQALGGVASLARDIPGAEAAQAGARALLRRQPYGEALSDIRGAEDAAPTAVRRLNRVIGGGVAAAALPKVLGGVKLTPALQGAALGVAGGALQADPNAGVEDRVKDAAIGGAVGGAIGKVGDAATNLIRARFAPTLGQAAQDAAERTAGIDATNYGQVGAEAKAAGGTSPALQNALEHKRVLEFAEMVRDTDGFENADDATVAQEAYKQMSKQRGGIQTRLKANGYDAALVRQDRNLAAGQKVLKDAMAKGSTKPALTMDVAPETFETAPSLQTEPHPVGPSSAPVVSPSIPVSNTASQIGNPGVRMDTPGMRVQIAPPEAVPPVAPSFPGAVAAHADEAAKARAAQQAADATRRLINETKLLGRKQLTQSPEAFLKDVKGYTPDQASSGLEAVLGRTNEYTGAGANPLKGFGLGPSLVNASKVSPFVNALETQQGGAPTLVELIRALIAGEGHPTP